MASIKVKFRPSAVAGRDGSIYYQVIHERKVRQFFSNYRVKAVEWDARRSTVALRCANDRLPFVMSVREGLRRDVERLSRIIRRFDAEGLDYTVDDVVDEFNNYLRSYSLFKFMEGVIVKLKQNGKARTSETYRATLNSFKKFLTSRPELYPAWQSGDIMLDCVSADIMEAYEAWHRGRGVAPNTISFYTRILRAVYNRAVEQKIIDDNSPFKHVYTGVDKTVKRALPLGVIRRIKSLDLSAIPVLDYARDMFMLSFYLRGMSFVDMAYLRKDNLKNGHVVYRRRKTGQLLTIEWTKEMQLVLDKYPENMSDYLLPIIRISGTNERCAYRNACYSINHNLKKIAVMAGIAIPLTLYVARHSWASAAKAKGIPVSVISEGMGHDSEMTTRIYLASLDTSVVDRANSLIISSL